MQSIIVGKWKMQDFEAACHFTHSRGREKG